MIFCILSEKVILADPRTDGSLELNYQRVKMKDGSTYSFGQKLNLSFADDLWIKNRLLVSIYLLRNQYSQQDRVDFRPSFSFNLSGDKYRSAYRLTPYKVYGASGNATNYRVVESNLSINPAKWTQLQFSYRHSHTFDDLKIRKSDYLSRYWAFFSNWQFKSFSLRGSYTQQEQINKLTGVKDYVFWVAGGDSKLYFDLPLKTSTSWAYDFSFTSRKPKGIPKLETPSHSFSTTWIGQPWSFLGWSVDYVGKFIQTKQDGYLLNTQTHSFYSSLGINLTDKWVSNVSQGYTLSKIGPKKTSNDYLSWMTTLKELPIIENVQATTSFRRTYYLHTDVGKYALNLFYISSLMKLYSDMEVRSNLTINYNDNPQSAERRYQVGKSFHLATKPKENIRFDLSYQTTVSGERIIWVYSEIDNYSLDLTYWGRGNLNLRAGYQANVYKGRQTPNSYSFSGEVSFPYRNFLSSTITYVRRWSKDPRTGQSSYSDNLSSQFNFPLARQTKLTLNYYVTDLRKTTSTSIFGVILNQQF